MASNTAPGSKDATASQPKTTTTSVADDHLQYFLQDKDARHYMEGNPTRKLFEEEISLLYKSGIRTAKPEWTRERIKEIIGLIEAYEIAPQMNLPRTHAQYHYTQKYEVYNINNEKCLIYKRKNPTDPVIKIVPSDEYYGIISRIHLESSHAGRDKTVFILKKYYSIPISAVTTFNKHCQVCVNKKGNTRKSITDTAVPKDVFHNRGVVELIDMQQIPDENYKWILCYQDYITKFIFLRPLVDNSVDEIANELLKIFLEVGCPCILETEDREVCSQIIKKIESSWPSCKILNGKPKSFLEFVDVKRIDQIWYYLKAWMKERKTKKWSMCVHFVQFKLNTRHHNSIGKSPFTALFGKAPQEGFPASSAMKKEEELLATQISEAEPNTESETFNDDFDEIKIKRELIDTGKIEIELEPNISEIKQELFDEQDPQNLLSVSMELSGDLLSFTGEQVIIKDEETEEEMTIEKAEEIPEKRRKK